MNQPVVDLTIAVHSKTRPIARAVASVLDHTVAPVRVTVVAHNIDQETIRNNLGQWALDPRVRLLPLADGIRSPAGPLNFGLAQSTAPFIAVMGSDDELEPGALDSWLKKQKKTGAAAVIARIFHVGRGNDSYPPVRLGRENRLDPVKDRLSYRSAPLGLISREHFGALRFTEGLPSGEDLSFVTFMWFSGERIAFDRRGPAYVVHSDAVDRVTFAPRAVKDDFRFLDEIFGTPWFDALGLSHRRAIAVKLIRMHIFDAVLARNERSPWPSGERQALAGVVGRIIDTAPGVENLLSAIDRTVLESVLGGELSDDETTELLRRRWNYRSLPAILPRNLLYALHRQGPFRTLFAGLVAMAPSLRQRRERWAARSSN